MNKCVYYRAHVDKRSAWFVVGIIRSYEHLVFERTLDKESSTFEFFVPANLEQFFVELMETFAQKHMILNLQKLPNRLTEN